VVRVPKTLAMKMRRGIWDVWRKGRKASVTRAGPGGEGEGEGGF